MRALNPISPRNRIVLLSLGLVSLTSGEVPPGSAVDRIVYHLSEEFRLRNVPFLLLDVAPKSSPRGIVAHRSTESNPFSKYRELQGIAEVWFATKNLLTILRMSIGTEASLIHIHVSYQLLVVAIMRRILGLKIKLLYATHNHSTIMARGHFEGVRLRSRVAERLALRVADHVVVPTPTAKRRLMDDYAIASEKVSVVPAGVDTARISRLAELHTNRRSSDLLLCVARIEKRKNQISLLKAVRELKMQGIDVVVKMVGPTEDPQYLSELISYAKSNALSVFYLGTVPEEELDNLYLSATIMVFPTLQEMQGLVIAESLAFGLPVITSAIEPISDVVGKDGAAILVPPENHFELANSIEKVLRNPALRSELAFNGRNLVRAKYTWKEIATQTLSVYEKLLQD